MIKSLMQCGKGFACCLVFCLGASLPVYAQAQRGGIGGGGGGVGGGGAAGGGGGRIGGSSSGTRQYYNNGMVGEAMISSDPESRRLIVITDDETGLYVSQVITNLDRPKPQVLIKVVFLEVTHNNSSEIGVEGGYRRNFGNSSTGAFANIFGLSGLNVAGATNGNSLNPLGQNLANFPTTLPGGLYQIMGTDYQATLRAIAQAGKTEVLSRPSILARNNQPATITVGRSVPLVTAVTFGGLNNTPVSAISYQSVGIILKVTPFINSDGMVEMIVSPQISELEDSTVNVTAGITSPIISIRSADTVVVTPDGQPVIIGGLMQKTKAQSETKIPILGDIPLLGNLFKKKSRAGSKTELIIFLTPHIVMAPTQLAAVTAVERSKAELVPKAFTEQELNRYIDDLPIKEVSPATNAIPGKANGKLNKPRR